MYAVKFDFVIRILKTFIIYARTRYLQNISKLFLFQC